MGYQKNNVTLRNMRFKTQIVEQIEHLAKQENRSFNNMVETILMRAIESNNNSKNESK